MSSTLVWRPVGIGNVIGSSLKRALAPKLWQHDGSLYSEWTVVGRDWIPFLEGVELAARTAEMTVEARELIDLIERYGEVEVALT